MADYLQRYLDGEREQVWAELLELGATIRQEPLYSDARAVAQETMRRVRANVETLTVRLQKRGYNPAYYPGGEYPTYNTQSHQPPVSDVSVQIARIEAQTGVLPLSLHVFWEEVGSINFIGAHPLLPRFSDPLCVGAPENFDREFVNWKRSCAEYGSEQVGPFHLSLAPDSLNKEFISGGPPFGIYLPNANIDAPFTDLPLDYDNSMMFVDYLRGCFAFGGFPGFAYIKEPLPTEFANLAEGLLPI